MTAREIPDVARLKVIGFRVPLRVDDSCSYQAGDDEGPFRGRSMPVQLAHGAGSKIMETLQCPSRSAIARPSLLGQHSPRSLYRSTFELEFERGQFFAGQQGIGNIVLFMADQAQEIGRLHRFSARVEYEGNRAAVKWMVAPHSIYFSIGKIA